MRILFFDCFSGCAGDMLAGALRDLGVAEEVFRDAVAALGLPEGIHCHFHRGSKQGIAGWKFHVHAHTHDHPNKHGHAHEHEHAHDHEHGHAHGRNHAEIRAAIESSRLSAGVKKRALAVFQRIAVAEGRIHGVPPEAVGFHEVGAADSIADIVGVCAAIDSLGVDEVRASSLIEGSGFVNCAHGAFPLPAPATLAILEGIPLKQVEEQGERITPTGAAILAEYATGFGPLPEMAVEAIGYGLGTRDTPPRPNVLRAVLGVSQTGPEHPSATSDEVAVIETNLDDMPAEGMAAAAEKAMAVGALDAFFVPATMKKGRPGVVFTVLARPSEADSLANLVLRETSAFGVRIHNARRIKLAREIVEVSTPFGPVAVKLGRLGGEVVHRSPEFASCRAVAERHAVPFGEVFSAALAAGSGAMDPR